MKKQWFKLCMTACVIGGVSAGVAFGSGAVSGVMGNSSQAAFSAGSPFYGEKAVVADDTPLPGMFSGDYVAAGIQGVGFRVQSSGTAPSACVLYLYNKVNDDNWHLTLGNVSSDPSAWTTFVAALDYSAGWQLGKVGATPEKFQEDLKNVDHLQVLFIRKGEAAQTYTVSNLALVGGKNITAAADLFNWMVARNVSNIYADNGKGFSYWVSYVVGADTPPQLTIVRNTADGDVVKWTSVADKQYRLLRSASLIDGFAQYGALVNGTGSDVQVPVEGGPYYYKLEIVQ